MGNGIACKYRVFAFLRPALGDPARSATRVTPPMSPISRDDAWALFCEWTDSEALRRHVLGVEAAMRAYARRYDEDEELWAVTGLVHDLDYERYPDLETGHPRHAIAELTRRGYPQEVIDAVAGHADFMGVPRETRMAKALYAVDEMSGFVSACALVRPTGIEGMKPKSVRKKMKQPSFAAAVDREQLQRGADELGVEMNEHIEVVIAALAEHAGELGLEGSGESAVA
jgi:putative nucleotidyltransferase with HDIG domain